MFTRFEAVTKRTIGHFSFATTEVAFVGYRRWDYDEYDFDDRIMVWE